MQSSRFSRKTYMEIITENIFKLSVLSVFLNRAEDWTEWHFFIFKK